jgi:hypothetical protein
MFGRKSEMSEIFKIPMGTKVKCKISGFSGIVTGRFQYQHGCVRYSVFPDKLDKDGKCLPYETFDEPGLDVVADAKEVHVQRDNGGPRDAPPNRESMGR